MPLVSVLLAVHNGSRYLSAAVESVLGQTVADLELVAIDDGSTDETPDLLAGVGDQRVVMLRNEEQAGLAASLNRALEAAAGRYVARLDADDIAIPERLERQLDRITAEPAVAVVGTLSSAPRSSTRRCSSIARFSIGTDSATTRLFWRARTTTCGRDSSFLPTERISKSRSSGSVCTLSSLRFDEAMFSSPFSGRWR